MKSLMYCKTALCLEIAALNDRNHVIFIPRSDFRRHELLSSTPRFRNPSAHVHIVSALPMWLDKLIVCSC